MIPIREHHRSEINVIRSVLRTVNNHGTFDAGSILRAVVTVIPRSSVEVGLELVSERLSGSDWTLLNARNTIIPRGLLLKEPVPVQRCALLRASNVVVHGDLNGISPISLDLGCRISSVDENYRSLDSVRSQDTPTDGEVVRPNYTGEGGDLIGIRVKSRCCSPWKTLRQWVAR